MLPSLALLATLSIVEHGSAFDVLRGDEVVARDIRVDRGADVGTNDVRSSFFVRPDGTRVWNRWSEVADRRFRMEVGARADGAVEITFASETDAPTDCPDRFLEMTIPAAPGVRFDELSAGGAWSGGNVAAVGGAGVWYDLRAMGPQSVMHFGGASVTQTVAGARIVRSGKRIARNYGEYVGVKWVIREGGLADYDTSHFYRKFHYTNPIRTITDFSRPLPPGYYLEARETPVEDGRKIRRVTKAVHFAGGTYDVPALGASARFFLQPVLADGEDFSLARGFWLTEGYEPGVLYRSDWHKGPPRLGVAETVWDAKGDACSRGREQCGVPAPVALPDADHPELRFLRSIRLHRLFENISTWAGLDDSEKCCRCLDRELAGKNANCVMLSGLLDRHAYPASHLAKMRTALGNVVRELHGRGIKVLDHVDVTLLWNHGTAYRLLLEDPGILLQNAGGNACGFQTCLLNPSWRERMFAYLRDEVAAGVDGFQLDEVYFWHRGCTCANCRAAFRRDTGRELPPDDDPAWEDRLSPFRRVWRDWRIRTCTNFFVELRERTKDLNDHLVLSAYSYTGGFISYASGDIGQELLDLSRVINLFGIEVMTRNNYWSSRSELPFRRAYGVLGLAYGTSVWTWNYSSCWQADYCAWAMSVMAGLPPMLSEVPPPPWNANYAGFDESRGAMRRKGAEPLAKVALQFSTKTRDFESNGNVWYRTLFATAQALEALHVPYVFVPDTCWDREHLAKYDVALTNAVEGAFDFCEESVLPNHFVKTQKFESCVKPEGEAEFRARVAAAVGAATVWRVDAPDRVCTSLWREETGAVCAHFLNLTGCGPKEGDVLDWTVPGEAYPALGKDIVFALPDAAGRKAVAVSPDFEGVRPLATVSNPDGSLTVTLPKELLRVYTLVRIR